METTFQTRSVMLAVVFSLQAFRIS